MNETEARLQRMERLLEISRDLTSTVSLKLLLDKIAKAAVELTNSESAALLLLDEDSGDLRFVAATSLADQLAPIPVPVEGSIAGVAFVSGQPLIVHNPQSDPRYFKRVEQRTGYSARSLLAVPLEFQERRIGVLEVENKRQGEFDSEDIETLTVLAAQATVAIENARLVGALRTVSAELEQRVEERTADLSTANVALVEQIEQRRQAEEQLKITLAEKETLLQEIHHRVKNNLQVIAALLGFQADAIEDAQSRAAFQESQNRIQAMAVVHERLYGPLGLQQIKMEDCFRDLVADLRQSYGAYDIDLRIDARGIVLGLASAIPCGLIVNELVSNSIKHAFPLERKGLAEISVVLRPLLDDDTSLELMVRDNGVGLPANLDVAQATSLGLRLVDMFTRQLRGSCEVDTAEEGGTSFYITFPRQSVSASLTPQGGARDAPPPD